MRFEVSRTLDAIEARLSTDPVVARAVVDVAEVLRYTDLDGGRPASLLRLGQVIDALARHVAEDGVAVYGVVDRAALADGDLTSNERMVIRRWADDGLVEVLPAAGDRVFEVAELTGLPVLSRRDPDPLRDAYPWLVNDPGRLLRAVAGGGGAVLVAGGGVLAGAPRASAPGVPPPRGPASGAPPAPQGTAPGALTHPVLSRLWRCPEPGCALFGSDRVAGQPPARLRAGVPTCPRHEQRLADAGPRPPAVPLVLRVDGVVRERFAVTAGRPVVVGREPAEPGGVRIGQWLTGEGLRRVSRSHLALTLTPGGVQVEDMSTNGTVVRVAGELVTLDRGTRHLLGEHDVVEVHDGVELARPGRWRPGGAVQPGSVMSDAPTVALRLPR